MPRHRTPGLFFGRKPQHWGQSFEHGLGRRDTAPPSLGINSPLPGPKSRPSEQEADSAVGGGSPSAQTKGSRAGTSPVARFFVETNRSAQALRHRSVPNRQVRCWDTLWHTRPSLLGVERLVQAWDTSSSVRNDPKALPPLSQPLRPAFSLNHLVITHL